MNDSKIDVQQVAVADKDGTVEFEWPKEKVVGYGEASISPDKGTTLQKVRSVSIDSLVSSNRLPEPNVVKVDVEGAEPLVIEGMIDTLKSQELRVVCCEIHLPSSNSDRPSIHDFGMKIEDFNDKICTLGYEKKIIQEGDNRLFYIFKNIN